MPVRDTQHLDHPPPFKHSQPKVQSYNKHLLSTIPMPNPKEPLVDRNSMKIKHPTPS